MVASVRADSSADLLRFDCNEPYFHTAIAEGRMVMSAFCTLLLIPYTLHIYLLVNGTVCAAVNESASPTLNMNMNMNTFTAPKLILACLSESVCLCVGQSLLCRRRKAGPTRPVRLREPLRLPIVVLLLLFVVVPSAGGRVAGPASLPGLPRGRSGLRARHPRSGHPPAPPRSIDPLRLASQLHLPQSPGRPR